MVIKDQSKLGNIASTKLNFKMFPTLCLNFLKMPQVIFRCGCVSGRNFKQLIIRIKVCVDFSQKLLTLAKATLKN
jgi:hypothetical protein